ncbi:ribonucleoside-diphosphate reductase subunit alpha [Candidatus Methylacidiphilum infernorum]|uniref:Ribonucleoside-diphosphate reductase n=1 Tax=Methylacidiphilum infernorum (isolate V4) TaxID=481448 RepID=B3DUX8_METI4|nr:ribonucleoside-diphosphate reductase subunit alpha [Candidatus Methylacidiphilum infernorum]ACD83131.1 Oxygen-sensitive ribonucleotide reductase, alpha subunit fused to ATP-cone domains [Methylacidiphilum infernorum V4]
MNPRQLYFLEFDAHLSALSIVKRDGRVVPFDPHRIRAAVEKAFRADRGKNVGEALSSEDRAAIEEITSAVVSKSAALAGRGERLEVERIQDLVELTLMELGYHTVAKRYILYRADRGRARTIKNREGVSIHMIDKQGRKVPLDLAWIHRTLMEACRGLEESCSWRELAEETVRGLYDEIKEEDVVQAMILTARSWVEKEPAYTYVAARLMLGKIYEEALSLVPSIHETAEYHKAYFPSYIDFGVKIGRLSPRLLEFNLEKLAQALRLERDRQFSYLGLQILYDRYLLHHEERRIETPQYFWMRVAMGLALNEKEDRELWAIRFYDTLSRFLFMASTPTLFNSATIHPQLSSCYLLTVEDDLDGIFKVISDNARLSKWAGGLGNDWTNVRATGSLIRGTNGKSQGVIPFLKVANDTAVAVNQGGKRKGALCAYLETWHLDIEDFLELRKNTGDERRRTHDMNTANWIPDLFMKRVLQNGSWTLFSPSDVPDLHHLYGKDFEKRYVEYEQMADRGEIKLFKRVSAVDLWRKMLTLLFETGHPWITFKDPSNIRSPQDHVGVINSSNLCTEILLNTSPEEVAVCNLGSINLAAHLDESGEIDEKKLQETIRIAVRMLDNVIDINFYPIPEARNANLRHRPVGLGIMGFQDVLYIKKIPYGSEKAVEVADRLMEMVSYHAILSSCELAKERGSYSTFKGSKWDRGLLPIDTIDLLEEQREGFVEVDRSQTKDWDYVRKKIKEQGLRNSCLLAIAPTATISNITGVCQSIEPSYKNLYVKSNLSGDFISINPYLVADLKKLNLWDQEMIDDLKYYDGSVKPIERIPQELKELYATAFEIDPYFIIECASRRQKWIDMGQSLNLYVDEPSGWKISQMYILCWKKGLKTTYYLRSRAATTVEKSTLDVNARGIQPRWMKSKSPSANIRVERNEKEKNACSLDPECESCQ